MNIVMTLLQPIPGKSVVPNLNPPPSTWHPYSTILRCANFIHLLSLVTLAAVIAMFTVTIFSMSTSNVPTWLYMYNYFMYMLLI